MYKKIILIIGIGILIYYLYKNKNKQLIDMVKCPRCKSLNEDIYPLKMNPDKRMCNSCGHFFAKRVKINVKHKGIYLKLGTEEKELGTIIIKLYKSKCPNMCNNFEKLCEENPYKRLMGTQFFGGVGGDYINGDGTGSRFIVEHMDEKSGVEYVKWNHIGMIDDGSRFIFGGGRVFGKVIVGKKLLKDINDGVYILDCWKK